MLKPTDNLVKLFDARIGKFDSQIEIKSEEIDVLTQLRDTLLPQLISGKLRVPKAMLAVERALQKGE
ncbi:hypothetical protein FUAX_00310 [Fulvitalea axinellae]|uniref:Type I restriction modification DNA specificity domain-containing protein n=2 Tax=Fulvitalea axinellae TaxID=1182444 RepID=A0AAU9CMS3_9BACT|nr:hypothetical protein FUAX_00310 [Fulvitalea axinellae]